MAVYRQVMLSFWTDSFIRDNFSAEDKYFYLYLLTNTHTSLCGCYEVSEKMIGEEMGVSKETAAALIDRFRSKYNLIRYNRFTKEVLILKWSKYNWNTSPRFISALENELKKIKDASFKAYILKLIDGEEVDKKIYPIDRVMGENENSEYPIEPPVIVTVIDNSNSKDSNFSNSNNDINLENVNTDKEVKKRVRKKYEDTPEFTEFWNAYPKQKDKTKAREEFARVDVPLDVLLSALEIQKRSHDWTKEGGQYIPYPAKWLKGRRWEDSVEVNVQSEGRYDNLKRIAEEFGDD